MKYVDSSAAKSVIRSILCGLFMREESVGIMEVGILIVLLSTNEGRGDSVE